MTLTDLHYTDKVLKNQVTLTPVYEVPVRWNSGVDLAALFGYHMSHGSVMLMHLDLT